MLSATLLLIAGAVANGDTANEEIYGTWVNSRYPKGKTETWFPQKIVIKPGGLYEFYSGKMDLVPGSMSTFVFTSKWTDREGIVWYRMIWKWKGVGDPRYELGKIDALGLTWEFINSYGDYPAVIDPNHTECHIYPRE